MQAVVVTGPGGSGVSTVAAALALGATAVGREVVLACLHDDGSLAHFVEQAPRRLRPRPLALTEPGRWDVLDQGAADALQHLGAEGLAAEELRQLPSVGPLRAVVRLAEASLGADLLVLDAGPLAAAADLLDTVTRLPWVLHHCLGAQTAAGRALGASAVELSRVADRASAGAALVRGGGMRLDVVLPAAGPGRGKVRRALPGFLLQGAVPGLLVRAADRGTDGSDATDDAAGQDWDPLISVSPSAWPRDDEPSAGEALVALGDQLQAAWRAGSRGPLRGGMADPDGDSPEDARGWSGSDSRDGVRGWDGAAHAAPSLRVRGNTLVWRLPLPWVSAADVQVERRADDLLVRVHGRSHLVPMPAVARRGRVLAATLDGRTLSIDVELPERGWGGGA